MRRPIPTRLLVVAACIIGVAGLASCVGSPTDAGSLQLLDPTDSNIAGSFDLVSVNGLPLPSSTQVNVEQAVEVQAERIVIGTDRTWADTSTTVIIDIVDGSSGPPTLTASSGTLAIKSGTINFVTTAGGGSAFTGSVHADTLDVLFNGTRFVYVR